MELIDKLSAISIIEHSTLLAVIISIKKVLPRFKWKFVN